MRNITEYTTLAELIEILGSVVMEEKTPTPKKLREEAGEPIAEEERCKVYGNGYAVYDNGSGRTVVWVPACRSYTFYFDKLRDSEKDNEISEYLSLPEGCLDSQPWPIAITLIGDCRIEALSMQRKGDRKQNKTLIRGDKEEGEAIEGMEKQKDSLEKEYSWRDGQFGESPEAIFIREESHRELLGRMTDKQREVFVLYYKYGFTQQEIAEKLGLARTTVMHRLEGAVKKVKKVF